MTIRIIYTYLHILKSPVRVHCEMKRPKGPHTVKRPMPDKGPFHEYLIFVGYGAPAPGGAARAPLGACRASCTVYLERPPRAPSSIFGAPKNERPHSPQKISPRGGSNERKFERTKIRTNATTTKTAKIGGYLRSHFLEEPSKSLCSALVESDAATMMP